MLLDTELLKKTGVFALASTELSVAVGGGYFFGRWLGGLINAATMGGFLFAMAGFVLGIWRVYSYVKAEKEI